MKVVVPIKRVVDPYTKIRVRPDGSAVETQNIKMVINPFDEIALEQAIRWKEAGLVTEIKIISIGSAPVAETLRAGLALGADSALHIQSEDTHEPLIIAKCLAAIVAQEDPQLVIMGKQAIDNDCNQVGQMLAALLKWPQATFASKAEFSADKKSLAVTREVDEGLETLLIQLPALITVDLRLNEPRYATLPNIMQAKRKPLNTMAIASLQVDLTPHLEIIQVSPPPTRKAGIKVTDVAELLHCLRTVEKVIP